VKSSELEEKVPSLSILSSCCMFQVSYVLDRRLRWSKNWFLSCRVHERWIFTSYLRGGSETRDWWRMELRHTYFV